MARKQLPPIAHHKPIIPLKLYKGAWPPAPAGDKEGIIQNKFVFNPAMVYAEFLPDAIL